MAKVKFNRKTPDSTFFELVITPKTWEKIKAAGDRELYEVNNKYADYEELRIYFGEDGLEMEAHCIKEKQNGKEN